MFVQKMLCLSSSLHPVSPVGRTGRRHDIRDRGIPAVFEELLLLFLIPGPELPFHNFAVRILLEFVRPIVVGGRCLPELVAHPLLAPGGPPREPPPLVSTPRGTTGVLGIWALVAGGTAIRVCAGAAVDGAGRVV